MKNKISNNPCLNYPSGLINLTGLEIISVEKHSGAPLGISISILITKKLLVYTA